MWKIGVKNEDIIKKVTNLASPLVYSMCQIAFSDRLFLSWLIKESSPVGYVPIVYFGYKRLIHNYIRRDERLLCSKRYFYISNESSAFTHICKFPSRYNLAYSSGSSTASEVNAQSDPDVVFKSFSASQQSILSPYCSINYLRQKLEAFQSVHHVTFILCYTVLYVFLGLRCRFGRHRAEVHRTSCALVFALIRVRKHWQNDITQGKQ